MSVGRVEAKAEAAGATLLPYLLIALSSLFWAGNWVIGRFLRDDLPPVAFNFWRWTLAAAILAPFVLGSLHGRWSIVRRHWNILALLGITGASLFQTLIYLGLETTTTVNAVLLNASTPPFIMLWAWLIDRETVTPRQIAGVVLSFVGILVIVTRGELAQLLDVRTSTAATSSSPPAMPIWGLYAVVLKRRPVALSGLEFDLRHGAVRPRAPCCLCLIAEGVLVGLPTINATSRCRHRLCRGLRLAARLYLLQPRRPRGRRQCRWLHDIPCCRPSRRSWRSSCSASSSASFTSSASPCCSAAWRCR